MPNTNILSKRFWRDLTDPTPSDGGIGPQAPLEGEAALRTLKAAITPTSMLTFLHFHSVRLPGGESLAYNLKHRPFTGPDILPFLAPYYVGFPEPGTGVLAEGYQASAMAGEIRRLIRRIRLMLYGMVGFSREGSRWCTVTGDMLRWWEVITGLGSLVWGGRWEVVCWNWWVWDEEMRKWGVWAQSRFVRRGVSNATRAQMIIKKVSDAISRTKRRLQGVFKRSRLS